MEQYYGELKDGKKHGYGILYGTIGGRGFKYEGEWKEGKKDGHGVWTYEDGEKYDGEWKNNLRHGHGIEYTQSGSKITEGNWVKGKLDGKAIITRKCADNKNIYYIEIWENGKYLCIKPYKPESEEITSPKNPRIIYSTDTPGIIFLNEGDIKGSHL